MSDAQKDGPAFPVTAGQEVYATGMTLRDWFAGQALAGMAGRSDWCKADVREIYDIADAMLEARK